jgi:hypothetical protein
MEHAHIFILSGECFLFRFLLSGDWNNEVGAINEEYRTNFGKTNKFAMIRANADSGNNIK